MGAVVEGGVEEGGEGVEEAGEGVRLRGSPAGKLGCFIGRRAKQRRKKKKRTRCGQHWFICNEYEQLLDLHAYTGIHVYTCTCTYKYLCNLLHVQCIYSTWCIGESVDSLYG